MIPFFKSDYYAFTREFHRKLLYTGGLIIYPNKEGIPQEILLIPHQIDIYEPVDKIISEVLQDSNKKGIITYFQGIRLMQKDLKLIISNLPYIRGRQSGYSILGDAIRVGCGIIVCDTTFVHLQTIGDNNRVYKVSLDIDNTNYELNCIDMPNAMGTPKYFINLQNEGNLNLNSLNEGRKE
jgi:hypothetical protein